MSFIKGKKGKQRFTEESRKKMSEQRKGKNNPFYGKHHTEENMSLGKKGRPNGWKGKHHTKESREKMRSVHMGQASPNKGVPCSEEQKQKIRETLTGRKNGPPTEEHRIKISEARMGHIVTEGTRNKIRLAHTDWDFYNEYGCTRSQYPYGSDWTAKLRKQIAERDDYTCQMCNEVLPDIVATHHIDYDKDNSNSSNLIFLCNYCHMKTNHNRIFWEQYFKQLQIARGFGADQYNNDQTTIDIWT